MNEIQPEQYLRHFPHETTSTSIRHAALQEARENRKFEIDLLLEARCLFLGLHRSSLWRIFRIARRPSNDRVSDSLFRLYLFAGVVFRQSRQQVLATKLGTSR